MVKKLQDNSVWAKYDIDQDGTVSDEKSKGRKAMEAMINYVNEVKSLAVNETVNEELKTLMLACLTVEPKERCDILQVKATFDRLFPSDSQAHLQVKKVIL